MIKKFVEEMIRNISGDNGLFLFEIFHKIQQDLHDSEMQLIEAKYNNRLEYIKFKINDSDNDKIRETQIEQIVSDSEYGIELARSQKSDDGNEGEDPTGDE